MNDKNVKETVYNILGNLADHEQEVRKDQIKSGDIQGKDVNVDADTVDDYISLQINNN
jgi:hypothetical protein